MNRQKRIDDLTALTIGQRYHVKCDIWDANLIYCGQVHDQNKYTFTFGDSADAWQKNFNIVASKSRLKVYDIQENFDKTAKKEEMTMGLTVREVAVLAHTSGEYADAYNKTIDAYALVAEAGIQATKMSLDLIKQEIAHSQMTLAAELKAMEQARMIPRESVQDIMGRASAIYQVRNPEQQIPAFQSGKLLTEKLVDLAKSEQVKDPEAMKQAVVNLVKHAEGIKRDLTSAQPDFTKKANIQSKAHNIDNLCKPGGVKELKKAMKKAMELGKETGDRVKSLFD